MHDHNPYSAPHARVESDDTPFPIRAAGRWRRFFNYLIDAATLILIWALVYLIGPFFGMEEALAWMDALNQWQSHLLGIPMSLLYYTLMEGTFGVTVGKLCTGTCVADEGGRRIGFRRALLRSLCREIPFNAFSMLMSDDHLIRAWHDSLARTYVVLRRASSVAHPGEPVAATEA